MIQLWRDKVAELKLQLTSEVKSTSQQPSLIKNLKKKFSKIYEKMPMATFKTLDDCEQVALVLETEGIGFRQKILRNRTTTEPYAIILYGEL